MGLRLLPPRPPNEPEEATLIQRKYSNHPGPKQKRHHLLETTVLRDVNTSSHQRPQHLTNSMRSELAKDLIIAAASSRNNYGLLFLMLNTASQQQVLLHRHLGILTLTVKAPTHLATLRRSWRVLIRFIRCGERELSSCG